MTTTKTSLNVDMELIAPNWSGEYDQIPIFDGAGALAALVCGRSTEGTSTACGQSTPDEDEANGLRLARLFAAAPDLLDLLENVAAAADDETRASGDGTVFFPYADVLEAIARARG